MDNGTTERTQHQPWAGRRRPGPSPDQETTAGPTPPATIDHHHTRTMKRDTPREKAATGTRMRGTMENRSAAPKSRRSPKARHAMHREQRTHHRWGRADRDDGQVCVVWGVGNAFISSSPWNTGAELMERTPGHNNDWANLGGGGAAAARRPEGKAPRRDGASMPGTRMPILRGRRRRGGDNRGRPARRA